MTVRPSAGPLAGVGVVITRPVRQAATFAQRLTVLGGDPIIAPAMVIAPPADDAPFADALRRLAEFDYAIFVSGNAAEAVLARHPAWPPHVTAIAVGPTTADALISGGITNVLMPPSRYDSEGVLELPAMQQVEARRFVLFRGEGARGETGRETMRETLEDRGAFVLPVKCYRRLRPTIGTEALLDAWRAGKVDAVVVTSTEVLDNFLDMVGEAGRALLLTTPVFVPHPRIAAHAAARGLTNVVTTNATDAGLLAGLLQHFSKT
ncbi:MAG: uroporphyrinogen-III synthase [Betaproteobacteria bacterium]|nr:uroporphyrinogen-III synthase [Betaproteobacteria bacterium]